MITHLLRRLHRWAGLLLALPLIVQAVTGCVMAVDPLLETSAAPLGDYAERVPAMVAAARASAPDGMVPRRIHVGDGGAWVQFARPRAQFPVTQVDIDPVSLRVLDVRDNPGAFYRWVHGLHETFLLGPFGRSLVGWSGIGLLFLGLSGIPLWWPAPNRLKAALSVSRQSRGRRLMRELHGAVGIWALVLLLLQSVTGATLAFPQAARALAGLPPTPGGAGGSASAPPEDATPLLGPALAALAQAVPDADMLELRLPPAAGRPMMVILRPRGQRDGAPPATVMLDAASGRVITAQDPRTQSWSAWTLGWMRALHYGEGLGLGWRGLTITAGLALPALPVTGFAMWLLRQRRLARRHQAPLPGDRQPT